MKIRLADSVPFNLNYTLCCGQAFRWEKRGAWWFGVVRDRAFKIRQTSAELEFEGADEPFIKAYFGLKDDLPTIYGEIGKDNRIRTAIHAFRGLRILRQDPWECLISFICATYKNIAAIRRMLHELSMRYGIQVGFDGCVFYAFPSIETLAKASVEQLQACGLGYRAAYVSQTAKIVHETDCDFASLTRKRYDKAKEVLLQFSGVGKKVADCVLLFSLGKLEAFPVDVWIRRAILDHYSNRFPREIILRMQNAKGLSDSDYERLNSFGRRYFGTFAGYAQEYLYTYERNRG